MIVLPLSRRNPPPSSATCCVMLYLVYFLSTVTAMVLQSPKPRTASPTSCSSFLGRTYNVNCAPQVTSPPALTAFLVVHPKKERKEATELGQTGIAKNHYEVFLPQEQIDIYAESTSPAAALVVGEPRPKGATSSHLVCRSTVAHHKIHQRSGVVNFEKTLKKWKLRLITREDPFSIHKISSIAYTMSAAIILGTGAIQFFQSPETFSEVPPSLLIPGYIFAISNAVMCCGSVKMAFQHRRNDVTSRNVFLGTAASSLFSGFHFLWTSPFGPEIFNNQLVNQSYHIIFILLNTVFTLDTLVKIPEVVESRRDRKAEEYPRRVVMDAVGYILPVVWGLPPIIVAVYFQAFVHDRLWFFEQCTYIDQMRGVPGLLPTLCYLQVAGSLSASFAALFVTLRDKKLVSKNQEIWGITVLSVPTMIWAMYGGGLFFQLFD